MKITKVKDKDGSTTQDLYKTETGSIIIHNPQALENYLKRKELALSKHNKIESLEDEINNLKKMIMDITRAKNG